MARNERMNDNKKLLEEKVISISRITKVTKGGRIMRFAATVVVGDGKGLIGLGTGKAAEVQPAINKASQAARKNLVKVAMVDGRTVPAELPISTLVERLFNKGVPSKPFNYTSLVNKLYKSSNISK